MSMLVFLAMFSQVINDEDSFVIVSQMVAAALAAISQLHWQVLPTLVSDQPH